MTADKPYALTYFAEPVPIEIRERQMLNDSACDSRGRLFAGAKTVRSEPFLAGEGPGMLYRLDKEGERFTTTAVAEGFSVPNGIGFSPDDKTLCVRR